MPSRNRNEPKEPSIAIVGIGNKNGASLLQQGVVADPLPNITGGMNVMKEKGINGKGEMKDFGANPMTANTDLVEKTAQIGKAFMVAKKSIDAKRFVFKFPEQDEDASIHVLYDMRNTDEPIAIFKKRVEKFEVEEEVDGVLKKTTKSKLVTEKLNQESIEVIAKAGFEAKDLPAIVDGLAQTLKNKTLDDSTRAKILNGMKEQGCIPLPRDAKGNLTISGLFNFIKVFDENLVKSEENIKALKVALVVDKNINIQDAGLKALSETYNRLNLYGIEIKSYQSAMDVKKLVNGEIKNADALSPTEKAFLEYNEKSKITAMELNEAEKNFGVDANGTIILAEEGNVPYKSGGSIHEQYLKNRISEAMKAKKTLDGAFWANANTIDPQKYPREEGGKNYSEAEIAQAEKTIQAEAEKFAKYLGEEQSKNLAEILAKNDPIVTGMVSGDITKMQKAQNFAKNLMAVVRTGATRQLIKEEPINLVLNGYFKDGRQLGQANCSPKLPIRYNPKDGEKLIHVTTDIPKLIKTIGDDAVVNLKTAKMTVLEIIVDKDGVAKDIAPVNTMGMWKEQQKLGRVLKSLMEISGDDEKLQQKMSNLINFGGKLNGEETHYGLGAILGDEQSLIGQYFKPLIQELRGVAYKNGEENFDKKTLEEIQEKIASLPNDENYSTRNLGNQVVALQEKSKNKEDYFFRAGMNTLRSRDEKKAEKREQLKNVMLKVLNGKEVLPTRGTTLSIAKTALIVKAYIDPIRKGVNGNAFKIATDMGFKHNDFKKGKIIAVTKENQPYIRNSYYSEDILQLKQIEKIKTAVQKADAHIDFDTIGAKMESLQSYYDENKEVFTQRTSFYQDDEEVSKDMNIDSGIDDDLASALAELDVGKENEVTTEQVQEIEDIVADQEENTESVVSADEIVDTVDMSQVAFDVNSPESLFGDEMDIEEDAEQDEHTNPQIEEARALSIDF